jgi:hypothetical protein
MRIARGQSSGFPRMGRRRVASAVLVSLLLAACQEQPTSPAASDGSTEQVTDFQVTPEGVAAAQDAKIVGMHKLATVAARHEAAAAFNASVATLDNSPFDLTYFGGTVLKAATSYTVYVNCITPSTPVTCWGSGTLSPLSLLQDMQRSTYLQIVNQYIGADAAGKFPALALRTTATFANPHSATLQEIFSILSSAVTKTGASGYTTIYHVFLPQGTDMCIDATDCYSPDDPAHWTFCGFHGSVNFGAKHVLFSMEPYQGVDGCRIPGQTPHGLIDATASTLTHELIETITDPDLDGWYNGLFGFEMSDICFAFANNALLNGHNYFLQLEYSNGQHMCSDHPPAGV